MRYLYDSRHLGDTQKEILDLVENIDKIEAVDTSEWSEEQKKKFYNGSLKGVSALHDVPIHISLNTVDKGISYHVGVLIDMNNLLFGEEVLQFLRSEDLTKVT